MARRFGLRWSHEHPSQVWDEVRRPWALVAGISWDRLERSGCAQYPCLAEDRSGQEVLFATRLATADGLATLVPVEPIAPAFCYAAAVANALINPPLDPEMHDSEFKFAAVRVDRTVRALGEQR